MNWGRWAALTVATALVLVSTGTAAGAETANRVVLEDGFSGERGAGPDSAVWTVVETGRRSGAWQDGSGRLMLGAVLRTTKTFGQAYGRAEARVSMNRADEPWRAIGVVDGAGQSLAGKVDVLDASPVDGGDFHTYALDWTPETITWSIDGRQVQRFTPEKKVPYSVVLGLGSGDRRSGLLVDRVTVSIRVQVGPWRAFTGYRAGQYVSYDGVVYRVREPHTSLPGWEPTLVPALFVKN